MLRRTGTQHRALLAALLLSLGGCDDTSDDGPADEMASTGDAPTTADDSGPAPSTSAGDSNGSTSASPDPEPEGSSDGGEASSGGGGEGSTTGTEDDSSDTEGAEMEFHPEFVWVADFVREKCVSCHNMGQNGNLLLPSVEMTNDEVRLALDGGVATTGRLFIQPFDPAESQAYIMITNAAGEQFPAETTDRVAEWINLGAPYYVR